MLKEISAQRARGIVTGAKPLIQTGGMELLLTSLTAQFRQRVVTAMNNRETYHTVFYTLKTLIYVSFPQNKAIHYASILNEKETNMALQSRKNKTFPGLVVLTLRAPLRTIITSETTKAATATLLCVVFPICVRC